MRKKRMNKKGGFGILLMLVITLFGWFLSWIIIDLFDYVLDEFMENSFESLERTGRDADEWVGNYSTYQGTKTNFKRFTFWTGSILLVIMTFSYAYYLKASSFYRT